MVFHHILVLKSQNDIVGVNCNVLGTQKIHDNVQRAQKKTQLYEILPANCRLQKKIINFKHNCCFSDMCCCYWSHFINYVKLFFSRVNSFLDIYEWNHSDQSRITGECDPTKHFSLPVSLFLSIYDHAQTLNDQPPFC